MRIAVIAAGENLTQARQLIQWLRRAGHDCYGLKFGAAWQAESRRRIDRIFNDASHLLCLLSPASLDSTWLPFIVGLARGEQRRLGFYVHDPSLELPAWLSDTPYFTDGDELRQYYQVEGEEWAVSQGRRLARASLLEMGISYHAESLSQCVKEGNITAVELFLDSGYPLDVRDKSGVPLLCLAARSSHLSLVKLLLERGADIDVQSDDRGYSPLMDATQVGDTDIIRYLLELGANPDLRSKDEQTALVLAVGRGDLETARILVEYHANPDLADKLGFSARKYARLFKHQEISELFGPAGGP